MANKEFQVRHGLVVNNSVFVANVITGNVGIGTSAPSSTLQVAGNANITSNLIVTGVDVVPAINRNSTTAAAAFDRANTANGVAVYAADFSNSINTIAVNAYNVANAAASGSTDLYARGQANDAYVTAQSAFNTANTALTTAQAAYNNANTKLSTSGGTIDGSLTVTGNLIVSGNTTFISVTNFRVDDPLIYLAANNYVSDTVDIGFIANYVNATGANVHTGLYREHEDKMYYLFQGYDKEPANNHIGALSNNMTLAVLNADLRTSNLELFGANAQAFIITSYNQANAAFDKANSTLVTASAAYAQANSAFITAAGAFDKANTAGLANGSNLTVQFNVNGELRGSNVFTFEEYSPEYFGMTGSYVLTLGNTSSYSNKTILDSTGFKIRSSNTNPAAAWRYLDVVDGLQYEVAERTDFASGYYQYINLRFAGGGLTLQNVNDMTDPANTGTYASYALGGFTLGDGNFQRKVEVLRNPAQPGNYTLYLPASGPNEGDALVANASGYLSFAQITANLTPAFNKANDAYLTAQSAFEQANASNTTARSAYEQANSAYIYAGSAFTNANTTLVTASAAFAQSNSAFITASAAYVAANAAPGIANSYATSVGTSANVYATSVGAAGNTYAASVGVGANSYAAIVGTSANTYADTVGVSANVYAASVGVGANSYATSVGISANTYAASVGVGANTYATAIGTSSNAYATAVGTSSNTFAASVGVGANAYATLVGTSANVYSASITGPAFDKANIANAVAVYAADFANVINVIAVNAYNTANSAASGSVDTYARDTANLSLATAQSAFTNANTTLVTASAAFDVANGAVMRAGDTMTGTLYFTTPDPLVNNSIGPSVSDLYGIEVISSGPNGYVQLNYDEKMYAFLDAAGIALQTGNNSINLKDVDGNVDINLTGATSRFAVLGASGSSVTIDRGGSVYADNVYIKGSNVVQVLVSAYDQANAAPGIANSYATAVGAAGNAYTITVGTSGNNYATAVGSAGNTYAASVGVGANSYATIVGTSGNAYALATATAIGTAGNSYATAVGTSGNTFAASVGVGANAYSVTIGASSNAWTNAVVLSANNFAGTMANSANAFANTKLSNSTGTFAGTLTISNNLNVSGNVVVANNLTTNGIFTVATDEIVVGSGSSNTFINSTSIIVQTIILAGSNLEQEIISGNAYATAVGTSGNAYATAVGTSGNTFAASVGVGANSFASSIVLPAFNQANTALTTAQAAYANANVSVKYNASGTFTERQVFTSNLAANTSAFSITPRAANPTSLTDGDIWINSSTSRIYYRLNSGTREFMQLDASQVVTAKKTFTASNTQLGILALTPVASLPTSGLVAGDLAIPITSNSFQFFANNSWIRLASNTEVIAAFDAANAAPGIANSYATAVGTSGNAYASSVGVGANSYAISVGTSGNAYATAVGTSGNTYAASVGVGANSYATSVGTSGNAFATLIGASANGWANTKVSSSGGTITGDLAITGNLNVSGNTSFISVQNFRVDDPLIYLAANNYISDIVDIGFIANYVNATGANVHTGLYREHEDKMYYLFQGYDREPANNHIGALSNNMTLAVLNADIRTSNLVLFGANAQQFIISAFAQANAAPGIANSYATAVGTAGNSYATAVGTSGNAYALAIATSIGTAGNAYATAVGTSGNTFASSVGVGANSYATSVGTSANSYATSVGTSGNAYALATATSIGTSSNAYATAVGTAGNAYAVSVGTSGNNYATAVGTAGNTYAASVGVGANAYATSVGTSANAYAATVGTGANSFTITVFNTANVALNTAQAAFATANAGGGSGPAFNQANIALSTAQSAFGRANTALQNTTGTFAGELTVTGTIKALGVGGDEGGEIQLANAVTNSTLSGSVVIDVYQNKLRFFEAGGSNRGAFIDLSIASVGVGSNLFSGGGGTEDATARATASAAFNQANNANITAGAAFNQANAASITAAAAFNKANSTVYTSNVVIEVVDNTNAALRITQTGIADALRVEGVINASSNIIASGVIKVGNYSNNTIIANPLFRAGANAERNFNLIDTTATVKVARVDGDPAIDLQRWSSSPTINLQSYFDLAVLSGNNFVIRDRFGLNQERLRIDSSGNVLIGRTTSNVGQNVRLDVVGGVNAASYISTGDVDVYGDMNIGLSNLASNVSTRTLTVASNGFSIIKVRGDASNLAGEGGGAAVAVYVDGGSATPVGIVSAIQSAGQRGDGGSFTGTLDNSMLVGGATARPMHFGTNNTVRMTMDVAGNVGIGTSAPTYALDVNGTVNAAAVLVNGAPISGGGGGAYSGDNGEASGSGLGDIFRVHRNVLNANVTIYSGNNSVAVGPLTIASGKTLTIQANARSVIV